MALATSAFTTYAALGNREDLSDTIWRIDPTDTPFYSGLEREKAVAVNHEWQTQALAPATANAQLEGDDNVTPNAATPTARLGNITQIQTKIARVTGTQIAVEHAGRDDEMDYQVMLKGLELKRDAEFAFVGSNQAKSAGNATSARTLASVLAWIRTNTDKGASGVDPVPVDGSGARTDGTQRAFTEAQLKAVIQKCWTAGGKPETIMLGAFNKQAFSTFVGRGTPMQDQGQKKITAAADVYESDFGRLKTVPNRFMRARDCLVLQMDLWASAAIPGRSFVTFPLSKTGDTERKQILVEHTLVSRQEAGSGGVFDLTTS
jgi:hypothetical protein